MISINRPLERRVDPRVKHTAGIRQTDQRLKPDCGGPEGASPPRTAPGPGRVPGYIITNADTRSFSPLSPSFYPFQLGSSTVPPLEPLY